MADVSAAGDRKLTCRQASVPHRDRNGLTETFHQASVSRSIRPTPTGASRRRRDNVRPFSRLRPSEGV